MFDDLRLAARGMLRARGLTAAAVLCLALGIGGTTIVYSVTVRTRAAPGAGGRSHGPRHGRRSAAGAPGSGRRRHGAGELRRPRDAESQLQRARRVHQPRREPHRHRRARARRRVSSHAELFPSARRPSHDGPRVQRRRTRATPIRRTSSSSATDSGTAASAPTPESSAASCESTTCRARSSA